MATTVYGSYMSTSGAKNFIRPYLTYTISSTATTTTITFTAGCNVKSNYHTNAKITLKVSATGQTTQSKTVDDKNWGGGNHSMISKSFSWTRSTANASKTFTVKMSTNVDSSTKSITVTVPARALVTITYNSNGGSAVAATSLYYGIAGNVSSTSPTRSGYTFQGWATTAANAAAGVVSYRPGAAITLTAGITLYAAWKTTYIQPTVIGSVNAYRVAARGSARSPNIDNEGTVAYIELTTDKGQNVASYLTSYSVQINGSQTTLTTSLSIDTSDASKNVYYGYIGDPGDLLTANSYTIYLVITVTDANGETHTFNSGTFLSAELYEIDISADGQRVAFGQLATDAQTGQIRSDFGIEVGGDVYTNLSSASGTVDGTLYAEINSKGWLSSVIDTNTNMLQLKKLLTKIIQAL